ncbi:MAG: radical SAM protein [Acutalibacter sp.]|nr:radical SAM protein [Acutalibacter sp.]
MTNEELLILIERGISNFVPQKQLRFEVHVTEHCNLNCKQCSHFSPLAEESYLDLCEYKRDCQRLSELFGGKMSVIQLLGGEPLLHPEINEIIRITRAAFPVGRIRVVTNGVLLPSMSEDFWETCRECHAEISVSEYPIHFDYHGWGNKVEKEKGVAYTPEAFGRSKMMKLYPIRTKQMPGNDNARRNFFNCVSANSDCIALKSGKMYTCCTVANVIHLKKHFNLDLPISDLDGVDIYAVKDGAELLEKLANPVPFCEYCDVVNVGKCISCDWGVSRKDRYEWLAFEFKKEDIDYLKSRELEVYVFGAGSWGTQTVYRLQKEGIAIKSVLTTRKVEEDRTLLDVPVICTDDIQDISESSICLVALVSPVMKGEVYPLLSGMGFGDIVPVSGLD